MKTPIFRFLLFLLSFAPAFQTSAQDFIKLEGKILAADSKTPVPFASIGIPARGIGNISNEAGDFELKIPVAAKNATVCISALGYKELCVPASTFKAQNHTVLLEPANLQLGTVEIKALSAENLVKEAIKRIPENYADKPAHYTYYQRQLETINDKPAFIIESVNEAYIAHPKSNNQLTIRKSRGIATSKKNQETMNETWVSVFAILGHADFGKYRPYLHPSKYKTYNYLFEKEDLIGADTVYVVAFKPKLKKNGQEVPGDEGKLFIHNRSKAVIRLERKDNQAAVDKENNSFLVKAASKLEGDIKFGIGMGVSEYKKIGSRWYFSNFHQEFTSQFREKNQPVTDNYYTIKQLVVTNTQTENAPQIPESDRVQKFRNLYSTAPKDMNEAFWQQYNVLPLPEGFQDFPAQ